MANQPSEVRIVSHPGGWAVKLVGGIGNKPIQVTERIEEARETGRSIAFKYKVTLFEFDADGNLEKKTPWKLLGSFK
jgi:hypothetical protein